MVKKSEVLEDIEGDIAEETPVLRVLSLDELRALSKAASDIYGYFGGAAYEEDMHRGVEALENFGFTFIKNSV